MYMVIRSVPECNRRNYFYWYLDFSTAQDTSSINHLPGISGSYAQVTYC